MSKKRSPATRLRSGARKRATTLGEKRVEDDRHREILRERARRLAACEDDQGPQKLSTSIIAFRIGEERFGIESRFLFAAAPAPPVASVPGVGAPLEGLCLVRGQLLPVFNLLTLLHLPSQTTDGRSLLAIFGADQPEFGIAVDEVLPSKDIPVESIQELNAADPDNRGLVRGMGEDGVIVLDGDILLNHPAFFL